MRDAFSDAAWALRTHGGDLDANEVMVRINAELGRNYPEIEIENALDRLVAQGPAVKNGSTYRWVAAAHGR
jgi:hypothetical protein